jgi:hypothetical protein
MNEANEMTSEPINFLDFIEESFSDLANTINKARHGATLCRRAVMRGMRMLLPFVGSTQPMRIGP